MKKAILDFIVCPFCKKDFRLSVLEVGTTDSSEIKEGALSCSCGREFPIREYIPRFVSGDSYAKNFSFEWKIHSRTYLDSFNRNTFSKTMFASFIDFPLSELKGKAVLDAGCGMGRYAEVAQQHGATVIGFDLSRAIDVAFLKLGRQANIHFIQADIFTLPFKNNIFDFIYSFGVLHHTPDAKMAFKQLPRLLKLGGKISIFVYSSYNKGIVYSTDFWRRLTTKIPKRLLYGLSFIAVPLYFIYKIPLLGNICKMIFVISMQPNWRSRVLDTFDWYSPRYQSRHTHAEVWRWFKDDGIKITGIFDGEVTMIGVKE